MRREIRNLIKMLQLLATLFANFADVLNVVPAIKELIDWIQEKRVILEANLQIQGIRTQGATQTKTTRKNNLTSTLFTVMTFIYNHAKKTGNEKLADRMKITQNKLRRKPGPDLITQTNEIIKICDDAGEELSAMGISTEQLGQLKDQRQQFIEVMVEPKDIRDKKKQASENIGLLYSEIMSMIHNRLIPMMQACFEQSNPELWAAFRKAVYIPKTASQSIALTGIVRNAETGEPVNNAWLEIPGTGINYRNRATTGKFRIKNLEPGEYQIRCTHGNYHSVTESFNVVWGETTRLTINLRMTESALAHKEKQEKEENRLTNR